MNVHVLLTVIGGPTRMPAVRLRKRGTLIGRQRGCDIRIPSDEVSRRHCLINVSKNKLTIEDLNSANGTLLNGNRVNGRQDVQDGDRLQIGPLTFRVDIPHRHKESGKADRESAADREPVYRFADAKREKSKTEIEIELDPSTFRDLPQGEDFRDLLRGMDRE